MQILSCDKESELFEGVGECGNYESTRTSLMNYNATLMLKNKVFSITSYSYEWSKFVAEKSGFPQILPNGKWQANSRFFGLISWLFSIPVFEEQFLEIPLSRYSRLL